MDINTGINAYVMSKNFRAGVQSNAAELLSGQRAKAGQPSLDISPDSNEAAKHEGKTNTETSLPPPGDVGKIMDFKV